MSETDFIVGGYRFSTESEYKDAIEEYESIEYLRKNTNLTNSKSVQKLYIKLVEKDTFHTIIGISFLRELMNILEEEKITLPDELSSIHVPSQSKSNNEYTKLNSEHYKLLAERAAVKVRNSRIINIFLALTIIVMIVIALFSDRTMYTKFENETLNRYASWEEELNERQDALDQREKDLKALEDANE